MRLTGRHALLLVAIAALAAIVALLLVRPPVAAPGPGVGPSAVPPDGRAPIPAPDDDPWRLVAWQSVDDAFAPAEPPLLRIDGLVDAGDRVIGWGRTPMPDRNQFDDMGAVFVSADGISWKTVPVDHGVNAVSTSELAGVAIGRMGFLAYGGVCCQPEQRAFWHSPDGDRWTRLEIGGDLDPSAVSVRSVVGTTDGWVAVGSTVDGAGWIWHSDDGVDWESVLEVPGGLPGGTLADVTAGGDGLVAVGTVTGADGTYDGAIWTSPDGRRWERAAADDPALVGAAETQLHAAVAHAGGLFVTGMEGTTEQRVQCEQLGMVASRELEPPATATSCVLGAEHHWVSRDGTSWQPVDPAAAAGEHPIEFRVVVPGGPGLVVLGESSGPASPDTSLYTSADGAQWAVAGPLRPIGNGVAIGMAVRGRQLIAVADHFDGESSRLRVWLAIAD